MEVLGCRANTGDFLERLSSPPGLPCSAVVDWPEMRLVSPLSNRTLSVTSWTLVHFKCVLCNCLSGQFHPHPLGLLCPRLVLS